MAELVYGVYALDSLAWIMVRMSEQASTISEG
jgi:hypothetical protein